jgi:hypothetical protein
MVYCLFLQEEGGADLPLEILERLIRRPEDLTPQLEANLEGYKDKMLRIAEVGTLQ